MSTLRISDRDDRARLVGLIAHAIPDPITGRQFLSNAFAPSPRGSAIVDRLNVAGANPITVAQGIVNSLETYGSDVKGRHSLALLIDALKDGAGVEDAEFLAGLVTKYQLVTGNGESPNSDSGKPQTGQLPEALVIRDALVKYFALGELETLCFDLNADSEEIEGRNTSKSIFATNIVQWFTRRGRLAELVAYIRKHRPNAGL